DAAIGYLKGGIEAWKAAGKEVDQITSITAPEAKTLIDKGNAVFDVRKDGEYLSEHLAGAVHTPLSELNKHLSKFPEKGEFLVHCAGGYRSVIASSILKSRGIHNLIDVKGGYGALKNEDLEKTDYVCTTTL
ncbi:MAG: rhodanese-like domain-containing protein, partial [Maribacter dokdonensis]